MLDGVGQRKKKTWKNLSGFLARELDVCKHEDEASGFGEMYLGPINDGILSLHIPSPHPTPPKTKLPLEARKVTTSSCPLKLLMGEVGGVFLMSFWFILVYTCGLHNLQEG